MKLSELLQPRNVNQEGAAIIVGQGTLFLRMVKSGWITPIVDRYNTKLYAHGHVQGCCDLLEAGFYPGDNEPSRAEIQAAQSGAMRPAYAKA